MKKYLVVKMIVLFAAILLVLVGAGSSEAEKPYKGITYYVNVGATGANDGTSWQDAFTDLQSALNAAASGDEIWVAAGTYKPHESDRSVSFSLKSGVKIYGGFEGDENVLHKRHLDPSLTVLSGDIGTSGDDTDNSYHIVYANEVTDAVLDGFTVQDGRAETSYGGGMYTNESALTVSKCVFSDNQAEYGGGGMYNHNSVLIVSDCIFSGNQVAINAVYGMDHGYGGGMYNYNSALTVSDCIFSGNQVGRNFSPNAVIGGGGGMCNVGTPASESQTIISYCFFAENKAWVVQGNNPCYNGGGGMYNHFCSPVVESCTFEQNYSRYGGGMCNAGPPASPTVTNCVFNTNNAIDDGGGMYNSISDPVVTNCVFNANWARREGGGIYYHGCANASIVNSTFYRNGWGTCLGPSECSWFEALAVSTLPYTRAGGAIYIEDGCIRCTMTNVIFDSNAARYDGGAVFNNQPNYSPAVRKTFESCLFHGNISQEWSCFSGCQWIEPTPAPDHIYGTLDESNSLYDLDPLFVNASDGDFHLQYDSPCIDAGYYGKHGNHSSWPAHLPDTDFEGDRRVIDGDGDDTPAVDIGADEYKPE